MKREVHGPQNSSRLKLTCTSPADAGILIDDLEPLDPRVTDMEQPAFTIPQSAAQPPRWGDGDGA